jgi:DNA-binding GntR family transcriptional regulator
MSNWGVIVDSLADGALKPRTVSMVVADRLRSDILSGRIPPGTRLRQVQLAREFGVSTTPIREAFQLLHSEGIVESDPHRGVVVRRPSADDVAENYEIRAELESLAATRALERLTDEDIDHMAELEAEMEAIDDPKRYIELNYEFHDTLYRASGRKRLCTLIDNLRVSSSAYVYHSHYMSTLDEAERDAYHRRLSEEHQEILAACRARDLERLGRAVRAHLEHTAEAIVGSIRALEAAEECDGDAPSADATSQAST